MNKLRSLSVILTALISACTAEHHTAIGPSKDSSTAGQRLFKLHNDARRDGLPCGTGEYSSKPLAWNERLAEAAFRHAADMAENKFIRHRGSDGSSSKKRISDSGFAWSKYGENVAYGHRGPEVIVAKWLSLTQHCQNIMDPDYTAMGAAMVDGYWTAVYAKPRLPVIN
ncbi:MAG: CAP domain-containing protein [Gammaproteobacteria bacterium]|nr:CAP domain-containing protein [Gammaproteobacteria bacterium]